MHDKLFFFFDSEWVRIALPIVTATTVPTPAFQNYVLQQLPRGGTDSVTGSTYQPAPQLVPFYQKLFSLYGNTAGTPLAVLGCPFNSDGSARRRQSAQRKRLREPPERFAFERRSASRCRRRASITTSMTNNIAWFRFQADTGLQAAYTDPINPLFNADLAAAAVFLRGRLHARVFAESGELFQSRVLLVREPVRPGRFAEDAGGVSHRPPGQRRQRAVHHARRARQYLGAGPARLALLHQRQSGLDASARTNCGSEPTPASSA